MCKFHMSSDSETEVFVYWYTGIEYRQHKTPLLATAECIAPVIRFECSLCIIGQCRCARHVVGDSAAKQDVKVAFGSLFAVGVRFRRRNELNVLYVQRRQRLACCMNDA